MKYAIYKLERDSKNKSCKDTIDLFSKIKVKQQIVRALKIRIAAEIEVMNLRVHRYILHSTRMKLAIIIIYKI